jgi:hypothetical protein
VNHANDVTALWLMVFYVSTMPPNALKITMRNGGTRHAVRSTNPTSTTPKSPLVFTALVQSGA